MIFLIKISRVNDHFEDLSIDRRTDINTELKDTSCEDLIGLGNVLMLSLKAKKTGFVLPV
jgi:hypothetical protein